MVEELIDDDYWNDWANHGKRADADFWKEIDAHPAFTTGEISEDSRDWSIETHALQQLKYSEDGAETDKEFEHKDQSESAEDAALSYKVEGNRQFQKRHFPLAILNYKKGLQKIEAVQSHPHKKQQNNVDAQNDATDYAILRAALHTNIAICEFSQKNYRRCIQHAQKAIQSEPAHLKAYHRAAKAALQLDKLEEAHTFIQSGKSAAAKQSSSASSGNEFDQLEAEYAAKHAKLHAIQVRHGRVGESQSVTVLRRVLERLGVQMRSSDVTGGADVIEIPGASYHEPYWDAQSSEMRLGVLLLYPEFGTTDFLQDVTVTSTRIIDLLYCVFGGSDEEAAKMNEEDEKEKRQYETPSWDVAGHYTLYEPKRSGNGSGGDRLCLDTFYENFEAQHSHMRIPATATLKELMLSEGFRLRADFVVELFIVSKRSTKFYQSWLDNPLDI